MGFEMCGQHVNAKADVCVMDPGVIVKYLLLMKEGKVCKPYLYVMKICLLVTWHEATYVLEQKSCTTAYCSSNSSFSREQ